MSSLLVQAPPSASLASSPVSTALLATVNPLASLRTFNQRQRPYQEALAREENQLNRVQRWIQWYSQVDSRLSPLAKSILKRYPSLQSRLNSIQRLTAKAHPFFWEGLPVNMQEQTIWELPLADMGRLSQLNRANRIRVASVLVQIAQQLLPQLENHRTRVLVAFQKLTLINLDDEVSLSQNISRIHIAFRRIFSLLPIPRGIRVCDIPAFLTQTLEEVSRRRMCFRNYCLLSAKALSFQLSLDEYLAVLIDLKEGRLDFGSLSEALKEDPKMALEAVRLDEKSIWDVTEKLRNNAHFALLVLRANSRVSLTAFSYNVRNDDEVAIEAIRVDANNLFFVSEELKNYRAFALKAFRVNNQIRLNQFSSRLQLDFWVVLEAFKFNHKNFGDIDARLLMNREFKSRLLALFLRKIKEKRCK